LPPISRSITKFGLAAVVVLVLTSIVAELVELVTTTPVVLEAGSGCGSGSSVVVVLVVVVPVAFGSIGRVILSPDTMMQLPL
jgi:hypothetical protein